MLLLGVGNSTLLKISVLGGFDLKMQYSQPAVNSHQLQGSSGGECLLKDQGSTSYGI